MFRVTHRIGIQFKERKLAGLGRISCVKGLVRQKSLQMEVNYWGWKTVLNLVLSLIFFLEHVKSSTVWQFLNCLHASDLRLQMIHVVIFICSCN